MTEKIKSMFLGLAIGDALGVPFEFKSRIMMLQKPCTTMIGFGTYNKPPGIFSDDSSLTFCLAEALCQDFNLEVIASNFMKWYKEDYWTADNDLFDIGITTQNAISRLINGEKAELAGDFEVTTNGNGSLMRISPLVFYLLDKDVSERYLICKNVSSITHGHMQSVISCFFFLEFLRNILLGKDKFESFELSQKTVNKHLRELEIDEEVLSLFNPILENEISKRNVDEIQSTGYVIHSLEASLWCTLTCNSYEESVLKAVNLGGDTDTIASITGSMCGLLYGQNEIPGEWLSKLYRKDDIIDLADRMSSFLERKV